MHSGILNLNKPAGLTSRDVVNRVQRMARPAKVGHAGTLDPLATGVLVVCVGAATRLIEYVQQLPKTYRATFLLGRSSPTEDVEGEITLLPDPPIPSQEAIVAASRHLVGTIEQRPPAFSAIRVAGQRAYDLARRGEAVDLKPRPITVFRFDVLHYAYPELAVEVECGSGTYIRSLGRDLGELLGSAAVMSRLDRTAIGPFTVDQAIAPDQLPPDTWTDHLQPLARAVEKLPAVVVDAAAVKALRMGQAIPLPPHVSEELAAYDEAGRLVAILVPRGAGRFGPRINLPE